MTRLRDVFEDRLLHCILGYDFFSFRTVLRVVNILNIGFMNRTIQKLLKISTKIINSSPYLDIKILKINLK